MSLSSTAVPKYYGKFRKAVQAGTIPVCRYVAMEMRRIDELINNPGVYYDDEAVEGFIEFCEKELTLVDGSPVVMLDTFKLWGEAALSWYYYVDRSVYSPSEDGVRGIYTRRRFKKRLINKQMLLVPRGSAKSMYASFIQAYFLVVDTSTTLQVTVAPNMRQTSGVLDPIKTAIARSPGPLFKFLTSGAPPGAGNSWNKQKLFATKEGITNKLTESSIQVYPMSVDALQGLRSKIASVDEWLSEDVRENVINAIEQGAAKYDDYFMICTSSEGTIRNGSGDSIKMEMIDILTGKYRNPHVSIWYYQLDDVKEVPNPAMWMKASPNIGHTVSYETYQRDVAKAEQVPSSRNEILAKRFNLPMEGFTYFFRYEETLPRSTKLDFWSMPCSLGADLSQGDDFCAFSFLFPLPGEKFGVKNRCYVTSHTISKLHPAIREKYKEFIDEGSLIVFESTILDMLDVYDDLQKHIEEREYEIRTFGYDPYNAREFVERWTRENGPFGVEKVIQGAKTESVPLGEIKNLAERNLLLFDQKIMMFCMGNSIVMEDTNGNRKLLKARNSEKVDCVASTMDAFVAYKLHKDCFE